MARFLLVTAVTLITFLLQVLDGAKTLRSAVALWITHAETRQAGATVQTPPSPDPSIRLHTARRAYAFRSQSYNNFCTP